LLFVNNFVIKFQIQSFIPEERHAVLLIDEMAIKPGLQYDNSIMSVVGRPTMKLEGGLDSSKIATHKLLFFYMKTQIILT